MQKALTRTILAAAPIILGSTSDASVIFDDFNVTEGHFASAVNGSGSTVGLDAANSTINRVTSEAFEGLGSQELFLIHDSTTTAARLRNLSGGGTPANNVSFNTSALEDGWIGFYAKTTASGWTAQIYLEGASNNGSVPKSLIGDGSWHLYEWNLDDNSGGANGWGTIAGIIAGVAVVADGAHTIDSLVFRDGTTAGTQDRIYVDFVAKSDSGSVAGLVPEPSSSALALFGALGLLRRRAVASS